MTIRIILINFMCTQNSHWSSPSMTFKNEIGFDEWRTLLVPFITLAFSSMYIALCIWYIGLFIIMTLKSKPKKLVDKLNHQTQNYLNQFQKWCLWLNPIWQGYAPTCNMTKPNMPTSFSMTNKRRCVWYWTRTDISWF